MIIPFSTTVVCSDGAAGSMTGMVVQRLGLRVKQLVVRETGFPSVDHLVPMSRLLNSSRRGIELRCTHDELAALEPSEESTVSFGAAPLYRYAIWEYGIWPCPPTAFLNQQTHSRLRAGDLLLSERTQVKAIDGNVGHACELAVDPDSYRILQVIFQEGHFWHQKRVTVAASAITRVTEEAITVSFDRHGIDALPAERPAPRFSLHL